MTDIQTLALHGSATAKKQIAFNFKEAASLIGISYKTLWREIKLGYIKPNKRVKLISLFEICRFLEVPSSSAPTPAPEPANRKRFPRLANP